MRLSTVAQYTLGITLGLLTVLLAVGALGFLSLQQLSRNPSKPSFPAATKDTSGLAMPPSSDNSYPALVTYQEGLIVRDTPDSSSKVIDKLKFDDTVVVMGKSDDSQWEHVRVEFANTEGWVRVGNLKRAQ
ncbi:MAG TPA: SH3 domain-containing protein [Stenomitos sp.]